jgi:hypothetical protein
MEKVHKNDTSSKAYISSKKYTCLKIFRILGETPGVSIPKAAQLMLNRQNLYYSENYVQYTGQEYVLWTKCAVEEDKKSNYINTEKITTKYEKTVQ